MRRRAHTTKQEPHNSGVLDQHSQPPTQRAGARLVDKRGRIVVKRAGRNRHLSYARDLYTTLTNVSWARLLTFFCFVYLLSWTFFAVVIMNLCKVPGQGGCIAHMETFWDAFLFSLQTQATIGYGNYTPRPTTSCAGLMLCVGVQSVLGLVLDATMFGLLFTKLSLPANRAVSVIFSSRALVTRRDNQDVLVFRIGDLHSEKMVEGHITLLLYHARVTAEGERLDVEPQHLEVTPETALSLFLPQTIAHVIDETSPLHGLSADDMVDREMELVAVYEGVYATLGLTTQARQSYTPEEILWGYRFRNIVSYPESRQGVVAVDYSSFDDVLPIPGGVEE